MIPDYQTLMRPVLVCASNGEVRIRDVVKKLADEFNLTEEERTALLPSGTQKTFSNRVNWAKSYLKQAGLVEITKRGYFKITKRGLDVLKDHIGRIDVGYLDQFEEFKLFREGSRIKNTSEENELNNLIESTPDEVLRKAHNDITVSLASDLLEKVRNSSPEFFEKLIVQILLAMGYGGSSEEAGRALGQSGDDGVDGVIDQDPLGVDQIYVQAKRYQEGNNISPAAIRDFFGALSLKKASKGIFVTTSNFSQAASQTAHDLGARIVLINGNQLAKLMIRYNVGCREEEAFVIKKVDEDFFDFLDE